MLQTGTTLTLQNSVQCTVLCPGVGGDGDREDDTVIVVHVLYFQIKNIEDFFTSSLFSWYLLALDNVPRHNSELTTVHPDTQGKYSFDQQKYFSNGPNKHFRSRCC